MITPDMLPPAMKGIPEALIKLEETRYRNLWKEVRELALLLGYRVCSECGKPSLDKQD